MTHTDPKRADGSACTTRSARAAVATSTRRLRVAGAAVGLRGWTAPMRRRTRAGLRDQSPTVARRACVSDVPVLGGATSATAAC